MSADKFEYVSVDDKQKTFISYMREEARSFYNAIIEYCPDSEERKEAVKRLEECAFWANKAISHGNK